MSPTQIVLKQQGKKEGRSHMGTVTLGSSVALKTSSPRPLAKGLQGPCRWNEILPAWAVSHTGLPPQRAPTRGHRQGAPSRAPSPLHMGPSDRGWRSQDQKTEQLLWYIKKFPRTAVKEQPQHPNTLIVTWTLAEVPLTHKPTALEILQPGIRSAASELIHLVTHTEPMTKSICNSKHSRIQGQSFPVSSILHMCKV